MQNEINNLQVMHDCTWLCCVSLLHRLLCWIKIAVDNNFYKKYWSNIKLKWFQLYSSGKISYLEKDYNMLQKTVVDGHTKNLEIGTQGFHLVFVERACTCKCTCDKSQISGNTSSWWVKIVHIFGKQHFCSIKFNNFLKIRRIKLEPQRIWNSNIILQYRCL